MVVVAWGTIFNLQGVYSWITTPKRRSPNRTRRPDREHASNNSLAPTEKLSDNLVGVDERQLVKSQLFLHLDPPIREIPIFEFAPCQDSANR